MSDDYYYSGLYAEEQADSKERLAADFDALRAEMDGWKRTASALAELYGEVEARSDKLAEALEEIRRRSAINRAMNPNPYELTALLGDIYQIADSTL